MTPTRIVIRAAALDGPACDAPQAVVDYVNELRAQLWSVDEIPECAWSIYYADYYLCQVGNGGHSQFFYNARPWREVSRRAARGLRATGADRQAEILDQAVALIDAEPALLEQLVAEHHWDAAQEVAPRFERLDDALLSLRDDALWPELCQRWLREADEVERLEPAEYSARLDALAGAVPEREARERAAEAAREAALPQFEKDIRAACEARGLAYEGLTAGRPGPGSVLEWSFFASGARRVAEVRGGELLRIRWDAKPRSVVSDLLAKLGVKGDG